MIHSNIGLKTCLAHVSKEFPSGEYGTLDICDSYLPHAQAVLGYEWLSPAKDASRSRLAHKIFLLSSTSRLHIYCGTTSRASCKMEGEGARPRAPRHPEEHEQ